VGCRSGSRATALRPGSPVRAAAAIRGLPLILVAALIHQDRRETLPTLGRAEIPSAAAVREVTAIALLAGFLGHGSASATR